MPSPKGTPFPPFTEFRPWKYSPGWFGCRWVPLRTRSAAETLAEPLPESTAPAPVEFAQPSPGPPRLPHGQGTPLPSPKQ